MEINDLRYDLEQLPELSHINMVHVPDSMVVMLHDQYSTLYSEGVPPVLVSLITAWIALGKDAASKYQDKMERKNAIIRKLQAQLGYNVGSEYAEAGD